MPLVASHHQKVADYKSEQLNVETISSVVRRITFDILKEKPLLVAEVEAGLLKKEVLEAEIIRKIDKYQHVGMYDRETLINKVFSFMYGYGPIQELINDNTISDIDFTRYNYCTVVREGIKEVYPLSFSSEREFDEWCRVFIMRRGGIINDNDSHCRVADEKHRLRINVSVYPRSSSGTNLIIRKHPGQWHKLEDLIRLGMMNDEIADLFRKLALCGANILFCGRGAAGKTTLLRTFVHLYPAYESYLICESDTEIYPESPNLISWKIKKGNEGGHQVTLLDLVRDGQTMSIAGYVIGEIVGPECYSLLDAGMTGHKIAASVHAGSAVDCISRLITLCKMYKLDLSEQVIKRIIASSINIIVYMRSFKVAEIVEVAGYDSSEDQILTNRLYEFKISRVLEQGRLDGEFIAVNDFIGALKREFSERGLTTVKEFL